MVNHTKNEVTILDEILNEILEEENQEKIRKAKIIKKGCLCTSKLEKTGTFSKIHFLVCDVCGKQFDLRGNYIK